MAQVTGRVTVKLNGASLKSRPGASIDIGGVTREPVENDQGTVDYRETTRASVVTCTLVHTSDLDLIALRNFVNGTLLFECDSGPKYVVPGAFVQEIGELSEGEVEVTFGGSPAEQT